MNAFTAGDRVTITRNYGDDCRKGDTGTIVSPLIQFALFADLPPHAHVQWDDGRSMAFPVDLLAPVVKS